jgi:methylthioribose-1-phosphate isomerase
MPEYPTIKWNASGSFLQVIDQRKLPHEIVFEEIRDVESATAAIREMHVRGAPLIGAVAAYGAHFAIELVIEGLRDREWLAASISSLRKARPTAVNLNWAVDQILHAGRSASSKAELRLATLKRANEIVEEELERSKKIAWAGLPLIEELSAIHPDRAVNVLTHCNAGRLATIDYGTATAPIYLAAERDIPVHVWVDETRPRNQGARLTAWELGERGIPHTVVADNTGGHLMQKGLVDLVIVGTDRTTRNGDVVNKIGTYLKALAAHDNDVPFYVAAPSSSIDWSLEEGSDVPIELRDEEEIHFVDGLYEGNKVSVRITPENSDAGNYAFDVTPARLVTGLITERGMCRPDDIPSLFPEKMESLEKTDG